MNMKFQHRFMHLRTLRKTDCAPLQSLDARAKIQVSPLNVLAAAFMNLMFFRRQIFPIRLPIIGVKSTHPTSGVLLYQAATTGIGTAAQDKGSNLYALPIPAVPAPLLLLFRLNRRPEFIDFQVLDTERRHRFWRLRGGSTDRLQHRVKTHPEDAHGVPNAGAIECHWHNQRPPRALITTPGVARNELAAAVFA